MTVTLRELRAKLNTTDTQAPLSEAGTVLPQASTPPSQSKYPPPFLTMKRKAVRSFNGDHRVALYYVAQIDKYVSIPFDNGDEPSITNESVLSEAKKAKKSKAKKKSKIKVKPYDFFKHLKDIAKCGEDRHKPLRFESGEKQKVQPEAAEILAGIHGKLNLYNQARMKTKMRKTKAGFGQMMTFALGHAARTK